MPDESVTAAVGAGADEALWLTADQAADWAAKTGFAIFPAIVKWDSEGSKFQKPPRPGCRWLDESTADPEGVRALWGSGLWVVGVDCGKSGVFVVDIDRPEAVDREWQEVLDQASERTMTRRSVSRGLPHIYMRQPDGDTVLSSVLPFGEVKGAGGYVVVSSRAPFLDVPVTGAPPALLARMTRGTMKIRTRTGHRARTAPEEIAVVLGSLSIEPSLDESVTGRFLAAAVASFRAKCEEKPRRMAALSASTSMFIEALAGVYEMSDAYEALLAAYREEREMGKGGKRPDWNRFRERDFQQMWAGLYDAWESDEEMRLGGSVMTLGEAAGEKRLEMRSSGGGLSLGSEMDEEGDDEFIAEWTAILNGPAYGEEGAAVSEESAEHAARVREDAVTLLNAVALVPEDVPVVDDPVETGGGAESVADEPAEMTVADVLASGETPTSVYDIASAIWPGKTRAEIKEIVTQARRSAVAMDAAKLYREIDRRAEQIVVPTADSLDWEVEPAAKPDALMKPDGAGLLYSGGLIHVFFGEASAGKSWLAMLLIREALLRGDRVVWIDYEMGWSMVVPKLKALGIGKSQAAGLLYVDAKKEGVPLRNFSDSVRAHAADWVVVDSVSRALGADDKVAAEGGENSNQAFIDWLREELLPVVEDNASIVLVDHTGHGDKDRMRGASAKRQQIDVEYQVENVIPFSAHSKGHSEIICRKCRPGYYTNGETVGALHVDPDKPDGAKFAVGGSGGLSGLTSIAHAAAVDLAKEAKEEAQKQRDRDKWKGVLLTEMRKTGRTEITPRQARDVKGIRNGDKELAMGELVRDGVMVYMGAVGRQGADVYRLAEAGSGERMGVSADGAAGADEMY